MNVYIALYGGVGGGGWPIQQSGWLLSQYTYSYEPEKISKRSKKDRKMAGNNT